MKILLICLLALCVSAPLSAQTAPASQAATAESIRQLLEVAHTHELLDKMYEQIHSMMRGALNDALAGKTLTAEQQKSADALADRLSKMLSDSMGWDSMEPLMVDIYQKSLTEEEIQGMLAFYRTPAGQAMIAKLPVIMNNTLIAVQERQRVLMSQMQQVLRDSLADIDANRPVSGS